MTPDPAYWAANVAPLDDATLLRFIDAVEARRDKYQVALAAALAEGRRRNLLPNEKGPALPPGQSTTGRKT
jgi:hypothetical protein